MKIALYTSSEEISIDHLAAMLADIGVDFGLNPLTTAGFDMAVSYGGDGTFLSSVRKMEHDFIPIMGINSGRLGFLATVSKEQAPQAFAQIAAGRYSIERRSMIRATTLDLPNDIAQRALNEFTIQKAGTPMVSIEVVVDSHNVGQYWADGIIVSTPTGSTAYSLSVGGAILTPGCRTFIISPIAPHNLNIRPLVISDSSVVELRVTTRTGNEAIATIDNCEFSIPTGTKFELKRSKYELEIVKLDGSNFYKTIHEKLLWGVDPRN